MNILAICCALNNSYLAIKYNNEEYSEIIMSDENYHSLYLISKIKKICEEKSINLNKIDLITTNCGPGSFTGIRVALTVAKVIAGELEIPAVGLNTAEILLNAFDREYLLMDARRDMYFLGTKEDIQLIYKDKLPQNLDGNRVLCDKNCEKVFENALCFEKEDKNLGEIMIKLAWEKFQKEPNKEKFNYLKLNANYIQTPPIF